MAKKSVKSEETKATALTISHEDFMKLLQQQKDKGSELLKVTVAVYNNPNPFRKDGWETPVDEGGYEKFHSDYEKWHGVNVEMLKRSFSNQGGEYLQRYENCGAVLLYSDLNKVDYLKRLIKEELDDLETLESQLPLIPEEGVVNNAPTPQPSKKGDKIFVVYGHDKQMKVEVLNFLKDELKLPAFALDDMPNKSETIIGKFEYYSEEAAYALILMSPDDTLEIDDNIYKQARPNVIFETGYFMAKLGRENVGILLKGDVEKPSDLSGILHMPFSGNWKYELQKELKAAGFNV